MNNYTPKLSELNGLNIENYLVSNNWLDFSWYETYEDGYTSDNLNIVAHVSDNDHWYVVETDTEVGYIVHEMDEITLRGKLAERLSSLLDNGVAEPAEEGFSEAFSLFREWADESYSKLAIFEDESGHIDDEEDTTVCAFDDVSELIRWLRNRIA